MEHKSPDYKSTGSVPVVSDVRFAKQQFCEIGLCRHLISPPDFVGRRDAHHHWDRAGIAVSAFCMCVRRVQLWLHKIENSN